MYGVWTALAFTRLPRGGDGERVRGGSPPAPPDQESTPLESPHQLLSYFGLFFNDTATTEIYTLSLHDALPIYAGNVLPVELPSTVEVDLFIDQTGQREVHGGDVRDVDRARLHQAPAVERRVEARRRLRPVDHPLAKREQQRPLMPDKRVAVGAQLAGGREAGQHRRRLGERVAAAVLRAGELVDPDLGGNRDVVLAEGIGGVQRHVGLPPLGVGVRVGDLGAGVGPAAAVELPGPDIRQLVMAHAPRLGRLRTRVLLLAVLRPRQPGRLREPDIERAAVGGLVRDRPFDHLAVVLGFVEAELDERPDPAAALGRAVDQGVLDRVAQGIRRALHGRQLLALAVAVAVAVAVAQEGDEVARRGEAQSHHSRVLRRVEELVDVVRVETTLQTDLLRARDAGEGHRRAVRECPLAVRDELAQVVLMDAPGERGAAVAGADGLVGGGFGDVLRTRRHAKDVLGSHPAGDLGAVTVPGDRQRDLDAGRQIAFPADPRHRVALTLEEPVAGVGRAAADVQVGDALVPTVHHVVDQRVVAAGRVDGLEDREVR